MHICEETYLSWHGLEEIFKRCQSWHISVTSESPTWFTPSKLLLDMAVRYFRTDNYFLNSDSRIRTYKNWTYNFAIERHWHIHINSNVVIQLCSYFRIQRDPNTTCTYTRNLKPLEQDMNYWSHNTSQNEVIWLRVTDQFFLNFIAIRCEKWKPQLKTNPPATHKS